MVPKPFGSRSIDASEGSEISMQNMSLNIP